MDASFANRLYSFTKMPLHLAIASIAILAAIACDNILRSGATRWIRYPIAVLIATVVCGGLIELLTPSVAEHGAKNLAALAQLGDIQLLVAAKRLLTALYMCTLVVALHAVLEAKYGASLALHAARLRALVEQRDVCAAELSAMQARVDPELLFESLRLVDEAYAADAALGQARLDALIRFLRAALPGKSGVTSTVRLEKELVEAYVALVASDGRPPHLSFLQASQDLLDEAMPPMILLPLVRWAMVGASTDDLTISIGRHDAPSAASLVLTVGSRVSTATERDDHEIDTIKERLECLYGDAVQVQVSAANAPPLVVVEIPGGG
ncbi:MAG: histidine kinase [Proteobacteria bacterium]|nr:histidine kinase [Pseudomonadota bacterium]